MSAEVPTVAQREAAAPEAFDGSPSASWPEPAGSGVVDLWHVDLGQPEAAVARAASVLRAEELDRANAASRVVQRRRMISRAALRRVLGSYLDVAPDRLRFDYGRFGKPGLECEFHFNLSASGDRCLVAVTDVAPIGIDVERIEPREGIDGIASRFLAPAEAAAIRALEGEEKLRAFYRRWTCAEACVKALGIGVASLPHAVADPGEWTVVELDLGPEHAGALALPIGGASISVRTRALG